MVANTTEKAAVQGTVLTFDSLWQKPVIPVFAGVTGWPAVEDGGFTRWYARPGQVILGMWSPDYDWGRVQPGRSDDEVAASDTPEFEVVLPLAEYGGLLLDLRAFNGGTLAVLEFPGDERGPAEWVTRELDTAGLPEAIREAGSYGRE